MSHQQKQQEQINNLKELKGKTKNNLLKQSIDEKLKYVNKPLRK